MHYQMFVVLLDSNSPEGIFVFYHSRVQQYTMANKDGGENEM